MLTKLLKKDFQATSRCFLPLIIGFIILSILCKILFEVGIMSSNNHNSYLSFVISIFMILYIIYIIGYYIMTYVFIISDFYKTMVGEQGYLTHTLPVKTTTLINSKILIAVLWQIVTGILIFLSILMFFLGHFDQHDFNMILMSFESVFGMSWGLYILFMLLCCIVGIICNPLMFYASIAMGHLFGKHRIIGAIASYLGLYTIMQMLTGIFMVAIGYSMYSSNYYTFKFFPYMWCVLIFSIVVSIGFYMITVYIFKKKLNLE